MFVFLEIVVEQKCNISIILGGVVLEEVGVALCARGGWAGFIILQIK